MKPIVWFVRYEIDGKYEKLYLEAKTEKGAKGNLPSLINRDKKEIRFIDVKPKLA